MGEYGVRPLYRMLGYFSIIGLLRVHSLLGDFTLALKVMENVELNQKVRRLYFAMDMRFVSFNTPSVNLYPSHCLPCHHLLLCRFLLHHAP